VRRGGCLKYPWNWEKPGFDDSAWKNAKSIEQGRPKEAGTGIAWGLEPREIPMMEAKSNILLRFAGRKISMLMKILYQGKVSWLFLPIKK
jgi:hypothetical protein